MSTETSNETGQQQLANRKYYLSEGLMLAISPAIAYFAVFLYEKAYCGVYGIPLGLIQPNLATILAVGSIFWSLFLLSLPVLNIITLIMAIFCKHCLDKCCQDPNSTARVFLIGLSAVVVFFMAILCLYFPSLILMWIIIAIVIILWTGSFFLQAKWRKDKKISYDKALINSLDSESDHSFLSLVESKIGKDVAVFIVAFFLGYLIVFAKGVNDASTTTNYLVPSAYTNIVVLRIYGDYAICAPYNPTNNIVQPSYFLKNLHAEPPVQLEMKNLGRLRVSKINISL